ncbi:transposase [Rhodococcus sp. HNM0563]|uniref:transposase n=1 Tax=Rhodococcus sp. HNM0563 TaxID=2716339 RepID=UPI00321748C8
MPGADTVPPVESRIRRGEEDERPQRHIAVDTNRLLLAVVVTMAGIQDRDAAFRLLAALQARFSTISLVWADGGYAGGLIDWAKHFLSLTVQVVKRTDDVTGFTVCPGGGWSSEPSPGSANTAAASATTRPDPTTTKPPSTSP